MGGSNALEKMLCRSSLVVSKKAERGGGVCKLEICFCENVEVPLHIKCQGTVSNNKACTVFVPVARFSGSDQEYMALLSTDLKLTHGPPTINNLLRTRSNGAQNHPHSSRLLTHNITGASPPISNLSSTSFRQRSGASTPVFLVLGFSRSKFMYEYT